MGTPSKHHGTEHVSARQTSTVRTSACVRLRGCATALAMGCAFGSPALAQQAGPLSVINWLELDTATDVQTGFPVTPPNATPPDTEISIRSLDRVRPEAVGLYPAARVGLPAEIWGSSRIERLAELTRSLPTDMLPALRDLSFRLLLAEFAAPLAQSAPAGSSVSPLLSARLEKLIEFGALDQAGALLDVLDLEAAELRLMRFNIGLMLGDDSQACDALQPSQPVSEAPLSDVPETLRSAMIFCQARAGDWQGAAARLQAGTDEGALDPYDADLLASFLDAETEFDDSATLLPPPSGTPDPLHLRLREASGDPVSISQLPVAFAHSDLRGSAGWRAQIVAAERLVRTGALPANRLLGIYTERRPAASGGIWERVRHVQSIDRALTDADAEALGAALTRGWPLIAAGELDVPLADLFGPAIRAIQLHGPAQDLAFRIGLLTRDYETVALDLGQNGTANGTAEERFLAAIARGLDPADYGQMRGEVAQAVALAFGEKAELRPESLAAIQDGRLGEEILETLVRLGGPADPRVLAEGLAFLRHVGLEDIARRTALESLLLDRRG